jgi:hypothetical protein
VSSVLSTDPSVKAVAACAYRAFIPRLFCLILRTSLQRLQSKYASIIFGFSIISSPKHIHRIHMAPRLCGKMWLRSHTRYIYLSVNLPPDIVSDSNPQYEFLASSILALAAQHLTVSNKADYSVEALNLRISAIRGLNDALSQPCHTVVDADARYAAIIGLTFQSTYMPDGLMEFIAMMRGWMLISTTLVTDHRTSMFRQFTRDSWVGSMEKFVEEQHGSTDEIFIEDFLASLKILQPLLQGQAELQYLSRLERLALLSKTSPRDGLFFFSLHHRRLD